MDAHSFYMLLMSRNFIKIRYLLAGLVLLAGSALAVERPVPDALRANPALSARFLPLKVKTGDDGISVLSGKCRRDVDSLVQLRTGRRSAGISFDAARRLLGTRPSGYSDYKSAMMDIMRNRWGVKFEPVEYGYQQYFPGDQHFREYQWNLENVGQTISETPGVPGVDINIVKVWDQFSGSDTLVVAVVDAGLNLYHKEFDGRVWHNNAEVNGEPGVDDDGNGFVDDSIGWDFVENDNWPMDYEGHGTNVAGVIAANWNADAGAGILSQGLIMPVRVMSVAGNGEYGNIADGIKYAVDNGAHVINFSIGGNGDNAVMRNAFAYAEAAGVPVIVSAGNEGKDIDLDPVVPSSYPFDNIVNVAAHDHTGKLSSFSNYGENSVHFAAPGQVILTTNIPPKLGIFFDGFESDTSYWQFSSPGAFAVSAAAPLSGEKSLLWQSGVNVWAVSADFIDLRSQVGASLFFALEYIPGNVWDVLVVEGLREGGAAWEEIAVISMQVYPSQAMIFPLLDFAGSRFKLRFRTSTISTRLNNRRLNLDHVWVKVFDQHPNNFDKYMTTSGTSIAAPHVTAYAGLLKLACDRTGTPFNRQKIIQGYSAETEFAGKIMNSARLDVQKGLAFYLNTLPVLNIEDDTKLNWAFGEPVSYHISVSGQSQESYDINVLTSQDTISYDNASGEAALVVSASGTYSLNVEAVGSSTLRQRIVFEVGDGAGTATKIPFTDFNFLSWMGTRYVLPKGVQRSSKVEIRQFDLQGRLSGVFKAALENVSLLENGTSQIHWGPAPAVFMVKVDGQRLRPEVKSQKQKSE